MKLAYVSNSIIPSRTANSIHVMKMCSAFARTGHEVTLFVPDRAERRECTADPFTYYGVAPTFQIRHLPWLRAAGRGYVFTWMAARQARRTGADLVYGRLVHACWFAVRGGVPAMFESHAPVAAYDRSGAWLFRRLIRHPLFRGLVVISDALRRHYEEQYPELRGRCRVARDAADDLPVEAGPRTVGDLRIGYTGHLYRGRGIEIIARLAERCPWAEFHLIGGLQRDIDAWRSRCGYLANLVFHGFCPPAEVHARTSIMDVLLAPYQQSVATYGERVETSRWMSPLKIFEYMAAGKPIVVSDLPVLREVLNDSNAILVDPADVDGWVRALASLRDHGLRERLGRNARRDFLGSHTWEQRARRVLS